MISYVVDFDDLCDRVASKALEQLLSVKAKYPDFKATLFTIPNRTSPETIAKYQEHPWLALAPHGWHHTRGECLTWPYHEAEAKLKMARDKGIAAPCFRAPAWLINRATYEVCRDNELVVCDHKDDYLYVEGVKVYRYNDPSHKLSRVRSVHGHLTNCAVDNYIGDMLKDGRLTFAAKREFLWLWQAAVTCKPIGKEEVACES